MIEKIIAWFLMLMSILFIVLSIVLLSTNFLILAIISFSWLLLYSCICVSERSDDE